MTGDRLILLNTSILTEYGTYCYAPLTAEEARSLVQEFLAAGRPVESSVSHPETAELLTGLLNYTVAVNPAQVRQGVGDVALVFKLRGRIPYGRRLSREEVEAVGYDFGLLTRSA